MNISDGLGDVLECEEHHGRLAISVAGEAGFVALDAAAETMLRDYLNGRAS